MADITLGDRMKDFYENRSKTYLTRRCPVILRIDGVAFHTFTKGFDKPFDKIFIETMQNVTKYLCEKIQGCKIGYVQSDEISLLLTDYDTLKTDAWFDYSVQKLCSVSASMAAMFFNSEYSAIVNGKYINEIIDYNQFNMYANKFYKAYFDSRCFNIPESEVVNYFIWRQNDATRNSIQGVAQANFNQKQLQNLNTSQLQEKLFSEKNINWNNFSIVEKRGTCIIKVQENEHSKWIIDNNIPIFTQNKDYIEKFLPKKVVNTI